MRTTFSILLPVLAASAPAQADACVPPQYQSIDAPGIGRLAGFTQRSRQQVLVANGYLSAARGRTFTSLSFRRDGSFRGALGGGQVDLAIALSETTVDPASAKTLLALNRTGPSTTVFQGRISLPASPALTSANEPTWSSPYAVLLLFGQGVVYGGSNLCLDIDGAPVSGATSSWWPIDQAMDASTGAVTRIGAGCGHFSQAFASRSQLVVGGSLRLLASGQPGSVAVALLGIDASRAVDMSFLGAPGCILRLDPLTTFTTPYVPATDPRKPGIAELELQIPNQPWLLGAQFAAQWLDFQRSLPPQRWSNPAGITFSNALGLTLSARAQSVFGAMIETGVYPSGLLPVTGHVVPCRLPVMRFGM